MRKCKKFFQGKIFCIFRLGAGKCARFLFRESIRNFFRVGFFYSLGLGLEIGPGSYIFCCTIKKGVLKNIAKFTGNYMCQSQFLNEDAGLRSVTLFKKRFWCRCFPVNFAKFLRTLFLQNTIGRLFLVTACKSSKIIAHCNGCFCIFAMK